MTFDDDDILGGKPTPSRPKKVVDETVSLKTADLHNVVGGVSVPWLMKAFRMGRGKVETALVECRPLGTHPNGGLYYDLAEAASYLVKPKKDLQALLKTITEKDLPHEMREGFWNAKIKEMKARAMGGDLWPTSAVMEVLSETFKTIKSTVQLWQDTIENQVGLTDEQRALIIELSDQLMSELNKALVQQAKSNATPSHIAELERAVEEA